tara:strand:+ start:107 stop:469 length:363 start_codon:yes stop_codon:yes gene_type:complete
MINQSKFLWFAPSAYYEGGQPVTIDTVLNDVAHAFNVTKKEMTSKSRKRPFTDARHLAMYLINQHLNRTQEATGEIFDRDHSTVNHANKSVNNRMDTDKKYRTLVNKIIVKNNYFKNYER